MKLPGVWHVGIDGTCTVCAECDPLSATRKELESRAAEWTCAPCPEHRRKEKPKQESPNQND